MKIENMLQRFSCISFLFKPPWKKGKFFDLVTSKRNFGGYFQ